MEYRPSATKLLFEFESEVLDGEQASVCLNMTLKSLRQDWGNNMCKPNE